MTYKGHAGGGVVAAILAWQLDPIESPLVAIMLFLTLLASQVPDVDHKGSWIGRRLYIFYLLFRISLSNPFMWILFGRKKMKRLVAHRGFTHTLLGLFISTLFVFLGILATTQVMIQNGVDFPWLLRGTSNWELQGVSLRYYPTAAYLSTGWFLGYLSHIALDMLTVSGVAVLKPWSDEKFFLAPKNFRVRMTQWDG